MSQVEAINLRKVYENGFVAVHGADFVVDDGEFVVLVGPSGCGKSTTLRMIAGLESITSGELRIGDARVNDVPPKDRDIAMVFQNYALYPHMSVFDNMAFGLKLRKFKKGEIGSRVKQAAGILGLEEILDRKPGQLSGGQRQRVAVGRAIVRKPKVFLFDEPLSNLDAKLRVQMRTEISKLHTQLGATMLYVTHDQTEAMTMGDRIVVMKDGLIQQIDTPLNLYDRPTNRFVAGFIGSPSMNFVSGRVVREDGTWFFADDSAVSVNLSEAQAEMLSDEIGKPVVLGVRPEDIYVAGEGVPAGVQASEVDSVLEVMEPMGNEVFVYSRSGAHALVARVVPQSLPDPGATVRLVLDTSKVHFFDAETEEVIGFHGKRAA
jgi:multiple sugar transport system ATP-binding protein